MHVVLRLEICMSLIGDTLKLEGSFATSVSMDCRIDLEESQRSVKKTYLYTQWLNEKPMYIKK